MLFTSSASNLNAVSNMRPDTGYNVQVFLKDLQTGVVQPISVNPDGSPLAVGGNYPQFSPDGQHVWFVSDYNPSPNPSTYYDFSLSNGSLHALASSPDGYGRNISSNANYAAWVADNGSVMFQNLHGGAPQLLTDSPWCQVQPRQNGSFMLSADGRYVASITADQHLWLADTQSGESTVLQNRNDSPADVHAMFLSADGSTLRLYGTLDGQNGLWQGSPAELLRPERNHQAHFEYPLQRQVQGSPGLDLVSYSMRDSLSQLQITHSGKQIKVSNTYSPNYFDTLNNVERIESKTDGLAFDIDGNAGQAYRLYQAAFARTPDQQGLGYWIKALDHGADAHAVAQGFVNSAEFQLMYGSAASNAEIVSRFYQHVLHRDGEASGMQYWTGILDQHRTDVPSVLGSFAESAENQAALVGVLQNGIHYTL